MVNIHYPTDMPLDEIKEIVRIVKAGSMVAERTALAKYLWTAAGYAQGMLLGDPANATIGKFALPSSPADTMVEALELIVAQQEGAITAQALPLPVALLLKLVIQALIQLLNAELGLGL